MGMHVSLNNLLAEYNRVRNVSQLVVKRLGVVVVGTSPSEPLRSCQVVLFPFKGGSVEAWQEEAVKAAGIGRMPLYVLREDIDSMKLIPYTEGVSDVVGFTTINELGLKMYIGSELPYLEFALSVYGRVELV